MNALWDMSVGRVSQRMARWLFDCDCLGFTHSADTLPFCTGNVMSFADHETHPKSMLDRGYSLSPASESRTMRGQDIRHIDTQCYRAPVSRSLVSFFG